MRINAPAALHLRQRERTARCKRTAGSCREYACGRHRP